MQRTLPRTGRWWRRLVAALAPTRLNGAERLAVHHAAEVRLAEALARDAESLVRYPEPRRRILKAADRASRRAQRIRRALDEAGQSATEPATSSGLRAPIGWDGLRAIVSELGSMSDAYLGDAYAMEHEDSRIAALLRDFHRESAVDQRDLIWTLAQIMTTGASMTTVQEVAA